MKLIRREVLVRAIRVSLVVGTLLALINHGETLLSGTLNASVVYKMILTYCVPFGVSLYSGVRAERG